MSELTSTIVVEPIDLTIGVDTNNINFSPSDISLTIYTNGTGGATSLDANIGNVHISGGTNGYVLQTDGAGNLTWTAQTGGGGGNGSPGGANTQIQYNDSGSFGGNAGFTFDEITGNVNMPANLNVIGNIYGTFTGNSLNANYANFAGQVVDATQSNITNVGTLTSLIVGGTTTIQQAIEKVTANSTGSTGTINYDLLDQAIILKTANATANFTLNFRGNSTTTLDTVMSSNQSLTCTFINTNGANGYYANVINIDSATVTPLWVYPGAPTIGTPSGQDVYTFNIIKTSANTYNVLAAKTGFV